EGAADLADGGDVGAGELLFQQGLDLAVFEHGLRSVRLGLVVVVNHFLEAPGAAQEQLLGLVLLLGLEGVGGLVLEGAAPVVEGRRHGAVLGGDLLADGGDQLGGAADGLDITLSAGPVDIEFFGAYTGFIVSDSNPYNFSRQDISDGAKRLFAGLSCGMDLGSGWVVTLNGLLQRDRGDIEASRYDTAHLSLGLEAQFSPAVTMLVEGAVEGGEGPESTGTSMRDISAWAVTFRMQFALLDESESAFAIDAAMATGSDNRYESTPGGIDGDGKDTQFSTFGTYSTGFAFEPDLSNLIYGALSFTTLPFSKGSMFGRSSFTLKSLVYFKADKAGPTSELATTDTLNNPDSVFLGFAVDATWAWRVVSDLSLVFAAGIFKPGTAYTDRTLQSLIQTTLVFAF
ncbi:MAG TPA: hypothetical protein PK297_03890, partial [Spirochaetota bacterium]|nr:hypothetical protein [Spirochaetota bacterium]